MKKKYKILLVVIAALALLLGASYAYWLMTLTQSGTNVVTTSCFELTFDEVTGSDINLTQAYPMTEEEGQRLTPYQFKIKNICDYIADYNVTLETINTSTLDSNYLRVKLNNNNSFILGNITPNETKTIDDADNSRTITTGTLVKNEEVSYDLRLWIDNDSTIAQSTNKSYSGKIVVIGAVNRNNHVITLNLNGATSDQNRILTNTGDTLGTLPTIDRFGYIFDGWYSDSEFTNAVTEETIVTNELTNIYAKWNQKTSKITYFPTGYLKWSDNLPEDAENVQLRSLEGEEYPVYSYNISGDSHTYIYTEAAKVYLTQNNATNFGSGSNITEFDLSRVDTSLLTGMQGMFYNYSGPSVDISSWDTSNVTDMSYMFVGTNIENLDLGSMDTSKVTNMYEMFMNANITNLNVDGWDTSSVTSMQYMFQGSRINDLDLHSWDTSSVTNMNSMFQRYQGTSLNISSFDTSSVTNMSYMFSNARINSLNLSSMNVSNVSNMSYMFYYANIGNIDFTGFGTSLGTTNVTMEYMFFGLSGIDELDLSDWNTSKVTTMDSFISSSNIKKIDISNWNFSGITSSYNSGLYQVFGEKGLQHLEEIVARNITLTSTDLFKAFAYETTVKKIDITGINAINGISSTQKMFYGCRTLEEIIGLNDLDLSSTTNISYMFGNTNVKVLDLSSFDTSNVTKMECMFQGMYNLTTIYVDPAKWNTDAVTTSYSMFYDNNSLVGGAGTAYSSSHTDKEYARVDGGESNPGYFTDIADKQ